MYSMTGAGPTCSVTTCRCHAFDLLLHRNTKFGRNVFDHWRRRRITDTTRNRSVLDRLLNPLRKTFLRDLLGHFPQSAPGSEGWTAHCCRRSKPPGSAAILFRWTGGADSSAAGEEPTTCEAESSKDRNLRIHQTTDIIVDSRTCLVRCRCHQVQKSRV